MSRGYNAKRRFHKRHKALTLKSLRINEGTDLYNSLGIPNAVAMHKAKQSSGKNGPFVL